jgi:hypothetical protein
MIIKVDEEGKRAITQLADFALRGAGLQVIGLVNAVSQAVGDKVIEPEKKTPEKKE